MMGSTMARVCRGASHSLAFMTELVELHHWRCAWCRDYLPDSPCGNEIDHGQRLSVHVYS
jgi:hypothetical protein